MKETEKYELMSDGIVAEIEDKLYVIFTYGPESRYYLAEIHSGLVVAAISMFEGCKCKLAFDEINGWKINAIDENGNIEGSLRPSPKLLNILYLSHSPSALSP